MYKIALIGAGQLGSRYLQGLAKLEIDISIEVVEPSPASSEIAKKRFEEIPINAHIVSLNFFDNLLSLSDELDLVIIATGADVRLTILKNLLMHKKIKNLILEKVLFQEVQDYKEAQTLLSHHKVNAWVNHPRRLFPFYSELKEKLLNSQNITYTFQGGNWGIGCNGLHFIDHLSFLSNAEELSINNEHLDNILYPSKRNGYVEFNGLLTGKLGNHFFMLASDSNPSTSILTIKSDKLTCIIDEGNGFIRISEKNNDWNWQERNEKIIYHQSELTALVVSDILLQNQCALPTYKQAMKLHVPFLESLLEKMRVIDGRKHIICPIT